jgi:hypothetical protein
MYVVINPSYLMDLASLFTFAAERLRVLTNAFSNAAVSFSGKLSQTPIKDANGVFRLAERVVLILISTTLCSGRSSFFRGFNTPFSYTA